MVSNAPLLESYLKKKLAELNTIIEGRSKSDPDKERRKEYDSYIDTQVCIDIRDKLLVLLEKMAWPGRESGTGCRTAKIAYHAEGKEKQRW